MTELIRSSHKVFKIKYHLVFCIKYRRDLFLEEKYVETVKNICKDIQDRFHILFETTGFDEDHVHFLVESLTTVYSPAKIFQFVKSITAIELFKRHPEIKNNSMKESSGAMEVMLEPLEKELMQTSSENTYKVKEEKEIS